MFRFRSCPKCLNGDMEERSDQDGRYLRCMQCGKHVEPQVSLAKELPSKRAGHRIKAAA